MSAAAGLESERKIRLVLWLMSAGFVAAVVACGWNHAHGLRYPFDTFLFHPDDRFHDFSAPLHAARQLDPYLSRPSSHVVYPPLTYALLHPLSRLPANLLLSIFLALTTSTILALMMRGRWRPGVLAIGALSYPLLFAIDRGNWELLVFILLAVGIEASSQARQMASGMLLGLVAAMKILPAVFALLLIARRQWRGLATMIATAVALTLVGVVLVRGTAFEQLACWRANQQLFNHTYGHGHEGLPFAHSLFTLVRTAGIYAGQATSRESLVAFSRPLTGPYTIAAFALMALWAAWVVWVDREPWRQLTLLVAATCLLPLMSGDYKLVHLLLPLSLFLVEAAPGPLDRAYAVLWSLVLAPKPYLHLDLPARLRITGELTLGNLLTPIALVGLVGLVMWDGWRENRARG